MYGLRREWCVCVPGRPQHNGKIQIHTKFCPHSKNEWILLVARASHFIIISNRMRIVLCVKFNCMHETIMVRYILYAYFCRCPVYIHRSTQIHPTKLERTVHSPTQAQTNYFYSARVCEITQLPRAVAVLPFDPLLHISFSIDRQIEANGMAFDSWMHLFVWIWIIRLDTVGLEIIQFQWCKTVCIVCVCVCRHNGRCRL